MDLVGGAAGPPSLGQDKVELVYSEMLDFCAQGFWIVLPLATALVALPDLRLSPLAGRRPPVQPPLTAHCGLHLLRFQR